MDTLVGLGEESGIHGNDLARYEHMHLVSSDNGLTAEWCRTIGWGSMSSVMVAISGPMIVTVTVPTPPPFPVSVTSVVISTATVVSSTRGRTVWTVVVPGWPVVISPVISPLPVPIPVPVSISVSVAIPVSPAVVSSTGIIMTSIVLPPMVGITRAGNIIIRGTWRERRPLPTGSITRAASAIAVARISVSVSVSVVPLIRVTVW